MGLADNRKDRDRRLQGGNGRMRSESLPRLVKADAPKGDPELQAPERLAAYEAQSRRAFLNAAFASMNDAVAIFDRTGKLVELNEAFATFFRFPGRAAMQEADFSQIEFQNLEGRPIPAGATPVQRALLGESARQAKYRLYRSDIALHWVGSFSFAPVRGEDGALLGAVLVARDVTKIRRAEETVSRSYENLERAIGERTRQLVQAKLEADRANDGKTRFLAAASHDLRQPLQSAKAYLSTLNTMLPDRRTREIAAALGNSIDVMTELLNSLLDVSRLQLVAIVPSTTVFSLGELIHKAAVSHGPAAQAKGLQLHLDVQPCFVVSDQALMMRIVDNLLSNAIRYTDKGGVTINCTVVGDSAVIRIEDTGIGVPPEALELIFDEYYQVDNPARDRSQGLGLGLSIVRYLTRCLGHDLKVASMLGKGTSFSRHARSIRASRPWFCWWMTSLPFASRSPCSCALIGRKCIWRRMPRRHCSWSITA